jgi:hypothetical protein
MRAKQIVAILVAVVLVGVLSLLFPMLSRFENSLGALLRNTVILALANLPRTVVLGVVNTAVALLCVRFVIPLFLLPALAALIGECRETVRLASSSRRYVIRLTNLMRPRWYTISTRRSRRFSTACGRERVIFRRKFGSDAGRVGLFRSPIRLSWASRCATTFMFPPVLTVR